MIVKPSIFGGKGIVHRRNYDELSVTLTLISALLEYNLFFNPPDCPDRYYGFYFASYI